MIIEDVIEKLHKIADIFKLNEYKGLRSIFMRFKLDYEDLVKNSIAEILRMYSSDGELIKMIVNTGVFIDMGLETIRIEEGVLWEFYHYPSMTYYYIRVLRLSGDAKWVALYLDENPFTPWWSKEERTEK